MSTKKYIYERYAVYVFTAYKFKNIRMSVWKTFESLYEKHSNACMGM